MKILKHGKLEARKFICGNCECQFVADPSEYSTVSSGGVVLWYEANCPDCGIVTGRSECWEEENEAGI